MGFPDLGKSQKHLGRYFKVQIPELTATDSDFSLERSLLQLIHTVTFKNHYLKLKFWFLWCCPCSSLLFS